MAKLSLILALYAAAVVTWLAFLGGADTLQDAPAGSPAGDVAVGVGTPTDAMIRAARTAAERQVQQSVQAHLADIDARLARQEALRKEYERILGDVQDAAELTAQMGQGDLKKIAERLVQLEGHARTIPSLRVELGELTLALEKAIKDQAARDARLAEIDTAIEELASRPIAAAGPAKPDRPTLPPKQPEMGAGEAQGVITQSLIDLDSGDRNLVFAALQRLCQLKARPAAPRIIQVLEGHKDEFLRRAAAMSLGKMESCDAVPALIEALVDKAQGVALQAARSVYAITGYEIDVSGEFRTKARRKARTEANQWWKENEASVRERLGQPSAG